ncbi:MAG: hypothetical protein A2879_04010 [Omnitrophica WOR_2 bacterium RIFCSPHIGHO2_01_FULL_49_10]|nr:MAG: hypothetical protein A2879_04010 [Omnitrophica WOR_2 bacterium RIFCSPHIGHO2_01_FULL_49_10]OGX32537.1 MAG: hypothetical protein A3I43_03860 [Omnitrophica WOR_2 bacterium RIFCSPLOWO2_02_FULL_50_19]
MPIRKIIFVISILVFSADRVYAAPAYGTDTPQKGKISIGYQTNLVFKHRLNDEHGSLRSFQHFVDFSYGALDWFTFDGKLGVGDLRQDGGEMPSVNYGTGFAGGYGFRILLRDKTADKTRIVFGFHHISVHPTNENAGGSKYETFLDDWQFDILGSKKFGKFEPFLGGKVSKFDLGYRVNRGERQRLSPKYYGGLIAGCGFDLREDLTLKIEGHIIDENSLSAGLYYKY